MSIRTSTPDSLPFHPSHTTIIKTLSFTVPTGPLPHIQIPQSVPLPTTGHSQLTVCPSGGEEVLLDVGGQDATEAFEDVGHSDEAREILDGLLVGTLKRVAGDPAPKVAGTDKIAAGPGKSGADTSSGILIYAVLVVGAVVAYVAYGYVQGQDAK